MFNPLANLTWRIWALIAAGLAALLFIGFSTQTIRIEGLKIWPFKIVGFKEENQTLRLDLDTIKRMQEHAREQQEAAMLRKEAEYREKAERTDDEYQARLADANARAAAYAGRMRVKVPGGIASGASASPESEGSQGADRPGSDAELGDYIAISQQDFEILNENTQRLKAAHEWAIGLAD